MTLEGEFPPPEPPATMSFGGHSCALEASGALVCLASSGNPVAEIVYRESQSPRVKVFESGLVTGP